MNRKKTYKRPQTRAVVLRGPVLMLGGSVAVNEYRRGNDITISVGDTDE